ncbi:MAG: hypothetical protein IPM13_19900 [Phycisphaerales bacterium]|nr:hypothetical protein [Phycisphaerales bacterium]
MFKSIDAGATWQHLRAGLPDRDATDVTLDPTNPNIVYAGIGDIFGHTQNGVYRSLDGGASWARLAGGLPGSGIGRVTLAVAPSQATRLYASLVRPSDALGGGAATLGVSQRRRRQLVDQPQWGRQLPGVVRLVPLHLGGASDQPRRVLRRGLQPAAHPGRGEQLGDGHAAARRPARARVRRQRPTVVRERRRRASLVEPGQRLATGNNSSNLVQFTPAFRSTRPTAT